ncbi:restriction endonuclease subunit S [Streptomyces albogriseolus]|uniref:restriction endonuclease subunit S n=1 Tax=Streptomyces albogriseolus TaxID=1887 RepID=UPI00378FA414
MRDGWRRVALGEILKLRSERTHFAGTLLSVTADRGVIRQSESGRRDSSSADKSLYWDVHSGDIVYNTMRMWQGVSGVALESGIVSPAYTVCEPTGDVSSSFLRWLLKEPRLVSKFLNRSQGLVSDTWNLKYSEFKKIQVSLPPLVEQRKIAEILDDFDAQISRERNILIKELTASRGIVAELLCRAVKEASRWSSIDSEFNIQAGVTMGPDRSPNSSTCGYLRVANVQKGFIDSSEITELEMRDGDLERWGLQADDLLVVEGHASPHEIGRCARVDKGSAGLLYQNHLFRLRAISMIPSFGEIWLNSQYARSYWLKRCSTSSGLYTINSKLLGSMPVPVVSKGWQDKIVAIGEKVEDSKDKSLQNIEKLQSLKLSIVNDLLSGSVRVPVAD